MTAWNTYFKAIKICVCLLIVSMLALLHYTLRQNSAYLVAQSSLTSEDERLASQWRHQRVLASSRGQETQPISTTTTTQSPTRILNTTQPPVTSGSTSETALLPYSAPQRPKPLPKITINSLLPPSNDTVFLPQRHLHSEALSTPPEHLTHHPHTLSSRLTADDILSPRSPGGGYVVVMKVYEQQTMASGNLLQLQCWASMLNMSLVTPYMKLSNIVTPLDEAKLRSHLSLWDTFSKTHWHAHTRAHGYLPMVTFEEWVRGGPRTLVVVQFKYPILSRVKEKKKEGIIFPHPHQGDDYTKGCEFKFISGKVLQFLRNKGFTVVRKVCLNFQQGDGFTFTELQEHLFGSHQPGGVTLLVDMWRGLGEPQRVLITDKICREEHPFREQVQPSPRLLQDAQSYKDRYLGPEDYIAVMARFEMTSLSRQYEQQNDTHAEIPLCIMRTLSRLEQLRSDTGIENTFVSVDIGKYGSISFAKNKYYHHLQDMVEFVRQAYGGRMAMVDVEHTLEDVSRTTDSGYIASLQQQIVTRAKCILFVGGGSFQRHTLHMYQDLHPHIENQCLHVVKSCTSPYRPIVI